MEPTSPQFKRLTADTPAGEKLMAAGFAALDKHLNDGKPLTAAKKKSMSAAYKKIEDARAGK